MGRDDSELQNTIAGLTEAIQSLQEVNLGIDASIKDLSIQMITTKLEITTAQCPAIEISHSGVGSCKVYQLIPTAALSADSLWFAMYMNMAALDPGTGCQIHGIVMDFSGVDLSNDPDITGLEVKLPAAYAGGTEIAGYFSGDGRTVSLCTDTHALDVSGAMNLDGVITGIGSITLDTGTTIDEFSTDVTLAGDSDSALPTEKAVKTYADVIQTDVDGFQDELKDLTQVEIQQLENIDASTISVTQWAYLGALDQALTQVSSPTFADVTVDSIITVGTVDGVDVSTLPALIAANTTQTEVEAIIDAEIVNGQSIDLAIDSLISTHNAADTHVAHSGVTITAGTGLSGGGTIAASRTIDCDITQYTDADALAHIVGQNPLTLTNSIRIGGNSIRDSNGINMIIFDGAGKISSMATLKANWGVDAGFTIDSVDISAHAGNSAAHHDVYVPSDAATHAADSNAHHTNYPTNSFWLVGSEATIAEQVGKPYVNFPFEDGDCYGATNIVVPSDWTDSTPALKIMYAIWTVDTDYLVTIQVSAHQAGEVPATYNALDSSETFAQQLQIGKLALHSVALDNVEAGDALGIKFTSRSASNPRCSIYNCWIENT